MDNSTTFVVQHGRVQPTAAAWDRATTGGTGRRPHDPDGFAVTGARRNRPTAS